MALDHGTLNLPLSKRGDIDKQIDAHKAQQAAKAQADRKANAATLKAQKAEAKTIFATIAANTSLLDEKAAKLGVTHKALIAHLDSWAKWEPAKLIKLYAQWTASVA
jgi:hypothetical protein